MAKATLFERYAGLFEFVDDKSYEVGPLSWIKHDGHSEIPSREYLVNLMNSRSPFAVRWLVINKRKATWRTKIVILHQIGGAVDMYNLRDELLKETRTTAEEADQDKSDHSLDKT